WTPENGGASGGAINVVTKSGANTLHGDAFLFGQFGTFNARPALERMNGAKPDLTRYRGGIALGGPLVKNRTFYYAAGEREHTRADGASGIDPEAVSAIDTALSSQAFANTGTRRLSAGRFPTGRSETEWSAKLTHQFTDGTFVGRFAATKSEDDRD